MATTRRLTDNEDHEGERDCPIHCSQRQKHTEENITKLETVHINLWLALGRKVSYMIFFSVITVCVTAMSYLFISQNENFKEHDLLAKETGVYQIKMELKQEIKETEARIISAIYDVKHEGKSK